MTSITAFLPPPDERAPAPNPSETANQRDSWLRQMELAQVADMNRSGVNAAPASVARPAQQSLQSVLPPAARLAPTAADGPAQVLHRGAAPERRACRVGAGNAAATARASELPEVAASLPESVATISAPCAAQPIEESIATTVAALARQPGLVFGGAAENQPSSTSEEAPVQGETAAGETPEWEERNIHFSGKGQEVDVWIRDSALTASASTPLLAQLAQEMAGMGLRMKNVTINGKAVHTDHEAPPAQPERSINHPEKAYGTR